MAGFVNLLVVSASSVARVLAICLLGVLMSVFPKGRPVFTRDVLTHVSYAVYHIFNPALILVKVATGLDRSTIGEFWPIMAWSCIHLALSALAGRAFSRGFRFGDSIRGPFLVACCFSNAVALPLILLDTVCLDLEELRTDPKCYDRSVAVLFLYTLPWHLAIWSLGEHSLVKAGASGATPRSAPQLPTGRERARAIAGHMTKPPLIALYAGIVLGLTPGLKSAFFAPDAAFPLLYQTANLAAQPAVTLMNLIMAASLALAIFRLQKARPVVPTFSSDGAALSRVPGEEGKGEWEEGDGAESYGEASGKAPSGYGHGNEADGETCEEADEETCEEADVEPQALSLSQARTRRKALIPITVGVIAVRYLIVPTCTVGLYLLAQRTSVLSWLVPESPQVRLSLLLLSSMPSAQLVLMLTTKLGLHATNSLLSIAYVVMYLVGIVSITGWLSLSLALVFD